MIQQHQESEPKGTKAILRAIDILDLLRKNPDGMSLREVTDAIELPKPTTHRILKALIHRGMVREQGSGFYKLGYGVLTLASAFLDSFNIRSEIRPALRLINQNVGETVHLGMLDESKKFVVYLDKLDSPKTVRMVSRIGQVAPVHCTALGKSLLSALSDEEVNEILEDYDFVQKTNNTITSVEQMKKELAHIRKVGYALDQQEVDNNVICIASNVMNRKNKAIVAISISSPAERMTEQVLENCIIQLTAITEEYSYKFSNIYQDDAL